MSDEVDKPDFVKAEGVFFLPHLLRRLFDLMVDGCLAWYADMGWEAPPRTVSTLHLLYRQGPQSVTQIASALRQSHPLAIQWIRQLTILEMVETAKDAGDRRRTIVSLTPRGAAQAQQFIDAHITFAKAYDQLACDADADPFDALWRLENILQKRPFANYLRDAQCGRYVSNEAAGGGR